MAKIEFIGNLGADARVEEYNGRKFVSFNVADTQKFTKVDGTKVEKTDWVSCTIQGDGGGLLPYLVKGKKVFVRGTLSTRIFDSAQYHCKMVGLSCVVKELELVGDPATKPQSTTEQPAQTQAPVDQNNDPNAPVF